MEDTKTYTTNYDEIWNSSNRKTPFKSNRANAKALHTQVVFGEAQKDTNESRNLHPNDRGLKH